MDISGLHFPAWPLDPFIQQETEIDLPRAAGHSAAAVLKHLAKNQEKEGYVDKTGILLTKLERREANTLRENEKDSRGNTAATKAMQELINNVRIDASTV